MSQKDRTEKNCNLENKNCLWNKQIPERRGSAWLVVELTKRCRDAISDEPVAEVDKCSKEARRTLARVTRVEVMVTSLAHCNELGCWLSNKLIMHQPAKWNKKMALLTKWLDQTLPPVEGTNVAQSIGSQVKVQRRGALKRGSIQTVECQCRRARYYAR